MSKGQIRLRLWLASLVLGTLISLGLSAMIVDPRYCYWLPGVQPGWALAWASDAFLHGASQSFWLALITVGDGIFYTCLTSRMLAADIDTHGRLSRFLVS